MTRERLEKAYLATTYFADCPEGPLLLRIDQVHPMLDALCLQHGVETWAYLTAHNPGSQLLEPKINDQRHQELLARIERRYSCYSGEGRGDDGNWPAERSLLILGISPLEGCALARDFGQLALVVGKIGQPARLIWTS